MAMSMCCPRPVRSRRITAANVATRPCSEALVSAVDTGSCWSLPVGDRRGAEVTSAWMIGAWAGRRIPGPPWPKPEIDDPPGCALQHLVAQGPGAASRRAGSSRSGCRRERPAPDQITPAAPQVQADVPLPGVLLVVYPGIPPTRPQRRVTSPSGGSIFTTRPRPGHTASARERPGRTREVQHLQPASGLAGSLTAIVHRHHDLAQGLVARWASPRRRASGSARGRRA
jgi:hypothetical protein